MAPKSQKNRGRLKKELKSASQVKIKLRQGKTVLVDEEDSDSHQDVESTVAPVRKRGREESDVHNKSTSSIALSEHALSERGSSAHGSPQRKSPRKQKTPLKFSTEGIV